MRNKFPTDQPDPFRRRNHRKRANGKHTRAFSPSLLAGTEEPDAQISIHPLMLKRVEWLARTRKASPAYILDEMLWHAMEHGPYAAPDMDDGTAREV